MLASQCTRWVSGEMRPAWNPRPRDPRVNPRLSQIEICPGQKFCKGWDRSPIGLFMVITCWLVVSTPLKNMKVSWDYCSQYIWKVIKFMFQTTNQHVIKLFYHFLHRLPAWSVKSPLGLPSSCWCSRRIVRRRLSRKRSSSSLLGIGQRGKCWENMGKIWLNRTSGNH